MRAHLTKLTESVKFEINFTATPYNGTVSSPKLLCQLLTNEECCHQR